MSALRRSMLLMSLVVLSGPLLTGCVANISQQDLLKQIEGGAAPLIIDVRTGGEYKSGHVPGAVNISVFDFRSGFEKLNPPKDAPIVLVCEHGPRASFAASMLRASGYKNVFHLDGDMSGWKKNKLRMEK